MKKEAMDGLFLTILLGERSELREKCGLGSIYATIYPSNIDSSTGGD